MINILVSSFYLEWDRLFQLSCYANRPPLHQAGFEPERCLRVVGLGGSEMRGWRAALTSHQVALRRDGACWQQHTKEEGLSFRGNKGLGWCPGAGGACIPRKPPLLRLQMAVLTTRFHVDSCSSEPVTDFENALSVVCTAIG